jgi:hypothetical protein
MCNIVTLRSKLATISIRQGHALAGHRRVHRTQIDRANPDMKPYLGLVTGVGRKKAGWWKGDIARYSFEGLILNLRQRLG